MNQRLEQCELVLPLLSDPGTACGSTLRAAIPVRDPKLQEDLELMRRVASGDFQSRTDLVKRLGRRIRAIAYHMCSHSNEILDLTQEVLIEILSSASSFRGNGSLEAWAKTITMRIILKRLRSFHAKWKRFLVFEEAPDEHPTDAPAENLDEQIDRAMLKQSVRSLLLKLKPLQRAAILLKLVDGHSVEEVAAIMERHPDSVRYLLKTARKRIASLASKDPVLRELLGRRLT